MTTVIAVLVGLCGILFGVICLKQMRFSRQKTINEIQTRTINTAEQKLQEIKEVQDEIRSIEGTTVKPEIVSPIPAGDSVTRLEHLNRVFNNKDSRSCI